MDDEGYIPLPFIANFNRIRMMTPEPSVVLEAISGSAAVEVTGSGSGDASATKLRKMNDWQSWTLSATERAMMADRAAAANANANAATAPRSRASAGGSNDDDTSGAASVATTKGAGGAGRGVEDITFVLEHALAVRPGDVSDDDFAPCGVFSARAHFERSSSAAADDDVAVARLTRLQLTRDPVDASFAAAFAKLVEDDLPYRVRVPANVLHPRKGVGVMASIPARCLADAQLQENFALHADELGNVVGVDYATMGGDCAPNGEREITPLGANPVFRTTAAVRHHKTAPRLDPRAGTDVRGHGGPGAKKERDADGNVKKKPPPSPFMAKYWMYVLPAMFLLSNVLNPPPPPKNKAS
mmetsp:Transcript_5716/g.20763  ORF Transcript_5716/g.20763 Transcript_5716/m.20763 type:complete len:357 (-) Transcript_5716:1180-2250(-)